MCGISGLISKSNSDIRNTLHRMTDIIAHRGPDYQDFYIHQNIGLGHRRLSIIDLSHAGNQPMHYLERYHIVFNGEIYNFKELKTILENEGYHFKSHTDTEVVMAAWDFWKEDCLNHFNGMWSFAIYDQRENQLFCARDRYGIKPFYYISTAHLFAFGSEIKQFTVLPEWQSVLNKQAAFDFLSWSFSDTSSDTFFQNVSQLPAGSCLKYDLQSHQYQITKWYKISVKSSDYDSIEDQTKQFFELLKSSVEYRLMADVKVGSCLSGGMDSTSIVMLVNSILRSQGNAELQETVSAVSRNKTYDESDYIRSVVESANCKSHFVYTEFDDFVSDFDSIIWHQDEPFGSSSIFAQWKVFQTARENGVTVMLDGQGSDEILAGYMQFFGNLFLSLLSSMNMSDLIKEVKSACALHGFNFKQILRFIVSATSSGMFYHYSVSMSGKLGARWAKNTEGLIPFPYWKKANLSLSAESREQLLYSKLPVLLHNEDRNSMAHSIESRVPFLDYRLVEFALSLPENYKINQGRTKYILRNAMKDILPGQIINRHDKMAFVTAEEQWVKENPAFFRNEIKDSLGMSESFINESTKDFFDQMIDGFVPFDYSLFRFICFGRWLKQFNVKIS
ncbi:MAG TPA: asparagine synthase (glutamine-hydrolyzing) [Candidatus Cloacimonadota bacterium]|nr:asparagine synthase (glutamine-hydrolyzing) [Candidatus Cloacimonadota bacterium]